MPKKKNYKHLDQHPKSGRNYRLPIEYHFLQEALSFVLRRGSRFDVGQRCVRLTAE